MDGVLDGRRLSDPLSDAQEQQGRSRTHLELPFVELLGRTRGTHDVQGGCKTHSMLVQDRTG